MLQAVASFFVSALAILALRPLAKAVDLIDRPGGRKNHHGNVPIIGGLAMFIAVVLGVGLVPVPGPIGGAYLAACAIVVTVGLVDDRFNLSPWTRLPGQIAATLVLSEHTVHRHVANILRKLAQSSRTAAATHAARAGII